MMQEPPNPSTLNITPSDTWHPLPARGRLLFRLGHAVGFAIGGATLITPLVMFAATLFELTLPRLLLAAIACGLLLGALFGAWLGGRRHGYYRWRLDDTGFAVISGKLWQRQTHVPATRVQHLDIKRGPLERMRSLATLTVHTAGTHGHALSLPCLDVQDAEALRAELARRIEPEGDDD